MLDALPDPDNPSQFLAPSLTPDPQMPSPTEQDAAPVKPVLSYGHLPLSYLKGKKDEAGDLPEDLEDPSLGTDPVLDPSELAHPQEQPAQPVSISLNEEE